MQVCSSHILAFSVPDGPNDQVMFTCKELSATFGRSGLNFIKIFLAIFKLKQGLLHSYYRLESVCTIGFLSNR